jgi:membrane protease YdiL (CAAX protease family)
LIAIPEELLFRGIIQNFLQNAHGFKINWGVLIDSHEIPLVFISMAAIYFRR